jgi:hypothetical protein
MSVSDVMLSLQLEIEQHLGEIERTIARYGLPLSSITLIARDPNNDRKIIVLNNDGLAGLEKSCRLAPLQSQVEYSE